MTHQRQLGYKATLGFGMALKQAVLVCSFWNRMGEESINHQQYNEHQDSDCASDAPAGAVFVAEQPDEGGEAAEAADLGAHRRVAHRQPLREID